MTRVTTPWIAAIVVAALASQATRAGELQWQKSAKVRKPATFASPSASTPIRKPAKSNYHRDGAVRMAAFEEEATHGPTLAIHENENSGMRSVVVREDDDSQAAREPIRSAQLEFRSPGSTTDNRYGDPGRSPFGDEGAEAPAPSDQQMQAEVEEGFVEEPAETPDLPSDAEMNEEMRAPSSEELALPNESDVEIKQHQLEEEPNAPQRNIGPSGTPAFGELQRDDDIPDNRVDPKILSEEEQHADEDCEAALNRLRARKLHDVNLNIAINGTQGEDFPFECSIDDGEWYSGRCWSETDYQWKASALCHKPLYFEDEALERYGHSWGPCLDPIVSGAHFFCKLPVLPYCMGVHPPNECMYALGHYRPGSCAPYLIDPVPLSPRGALFEAGAVTGAAAALP